VDCHYVTISNLSGREFAAKGVSSAVRIEGSSSIGIHGGLIEGKPILLAGPCPFCSVDGTLLQDADITFTNGSIAPAFMPASYMLLRARAEAAE
jgi:hypothetical protein